MLGNNEINVMLKECNGTNHFFRQINVQMMLLVACLLLISVGSYSVFSTFYQMRLAKQQLYGEVMLLAQYTALAATEPYIAQDVNALEVVLTQMATHPAVGSLLAVDGEGVILSQVMRQNDGELFINDVVGKTSIPPYTEKELVESQQETVTWYPMIEDEFLGWIKVSLQRQATQQVDKHFVIYSLLASGIICLVGCLVVLCVLRKPINALKNVVGFAVNLSANKGERVFVYQQCEEIKTLCLALNNISEKINTQNNQINNHAYELACKTNELTATIASSQTVIQAHSNFLGNMSHEMLTPLHGIIGLLSLLQGDGLDAEKQEYVDMMRHSAVNLQRLLTDMLDAAKLDEGTLLLEKTDFHIASVFNEVVALFDEPIKRKGLSFANYIDPCVPEYGYGDVVRFQQLITNLLSNAVKFTNAGNVAVGVTLVSDDEQDTTSQSFRIRCVVEDTGVGVPEALQHCIFETFTQADSTTTREHGGAGIGLSISKRLCELMGGEIGVDSKGQDQGSEFWFSICLEAGRK